MLDALISKYLESHKRLIIPQLGAFLVKMPDKTVVFSELLRRDDGALRQLLQQEGMKDLEVQGAIDRFIFEVRHEVERGSGYIVDGLGILIPGPNGTIRFRFDASMQKPRPVQPEPQPITSEKKTSEKSEPEKVETPLEETTPAVETLAENLQPDTESEQTKEEMVQTKHVPLMKPVKFALDDSAEDEEEDASTKNRSAKEKRQEKHRKVRQLYSDDDLFSQVAQGGERQTDGEEKNPLHVSSSAKRNPEPFVRGLQYRKPHKSTDGYSYLGSNSEKKVDRFLLFAILAIVLAIGAIAFGYWVNSQSEDLAEDVSWGVETEQVAAPSENPIDGENAPQTNL